MQCGEDAGPRAPGRATASCGCMPGAVAAGLELGPVRRGFCIPGRALASCGGGACGEQRMGADRRGRFVVGSVMFQMQWNAALPAQQAHTNYYFAGMSTVRTRTPTPAPARSAATSRLCAAPHRANARSAVRLCDVLPPRARPRTRPTATIPRGLLARSTWFRATVPVRSSGWRERVRPGSDAARALPVCAGRCARWVCSAR